MTTKNELDRSVALINEADSSLKYLRDAIDDLYATATRPHADPAEHGNRLDADYARATKHLCEVRAGVYELSTWLDSDEGARAAKKVGK